MAVSNKVSNTTLNYQYAKAVDTVITGTAINRIMIGEHSKPWEGAQHEVIWKVSLNSQGGSFTGSQILNTTAVNNTVKGTFDMKFVYNPSVLTATDITLNRTKMQVADLLERQIESDTVDLQPIIATQLYSDGTGNGSLDVTGLGAAVDSGSSVATYGGQSRTTYSSLGSTVTASSGTLTLAKMFTLWDTLQQDNQQPDMILTTKTVRSLYEQLLLPNLRYQSYRSMGVGADKTGLVFREATVVADSACTSGYMYFLNMDTFEWRAAQEYFGGEMIRYGMNELEGEPSSVSPKGLGFFATDYLKPVNQQTINKFVILAGNLICKNPRYNGVLTGVTSI